MSEPTLPADPPDEGAWSEQGEAVSSTPAAFSPGFATSTEAGTAAADLTELGATAGSQAPKTASTPWLNTKSYRLTTATMNSTNTSTTAV